MHKLPAIWRLLLVPIPANGGEVWYEDPSIIGKEPNLSSMRTEIYGSSTEVCGRIG